MRKVVPCATNHVTMFCFVVPSADDSGAGFALASEATPGFGWRGPANTGEKVVIFIISHKPFGPGICETTFRMYDITPR